MKSYLRIFIVLLFVAFVLPSLTAKRSIVVDKEKLTLAVVDKDSTLFEAPVCLGRNFGQKTREGDNKTPEGDFSIWMIQNSSTWTYDYHDGHGKRKGAYGPWFIRLRTPMSTHIGIHGTCFHESIGTRDSEGCVRMRNEDLEKLHGYIFPGMKVHITADPKPSVENKKAKTKSAVKTDVATKAQQPATTERNEGKSTELKAVITEPKKAEQTETVLPAETPDKTITEQPETVEPEEAPAPAKRFSRFNHKFLRKTVVKTSTAK